MTNKEKYIAFCNRVYVPIYSKPWWMDAVCEPWNWDVWLYEKNGIIKAAMPYYREKRGPYQYITKAPLTQNNGIIFAYAEGSKELAKRKFEEDVINEACAFIENLKVDVYEQQYPPEFDNWLPFFWNHYVEITRYSQEIEDTSDLNVIWDNLSGNRRKKIKKGIQNANFIDTKDYRKFYKEHEKIFLKQGLPCPFSFELWERLWSACSEHDACRMAWAIDNGGNITCVSFLVWDERKVYRLLGGSMPEYQNLDTYSAMTWKEIEAAHEKKLIFDFEGSVIKRISKANQEYGAIAKPYFRIRKIFNKDILEMEHKKKLAEHGF